MFGGCWRRRNREKGSLMQLGIANQAGYIMVLQQRIGEYLWWGESGTGSVQGCSPRAKNIR